MSIWKIQAARITLFPLLGTGSVPKSALELYKAVWGKDPDSFQSQPMAGAPFPVSVAQGVEGAVSRLCQTQPVRVDFGFNPTASTSDIATFVDTHQLHAEMRRVIGSVENALHQMPVNRVAVYLQIGQETGDYSAANKLICQTFWEDRKFALTDEEDFVFQLNRPEKDSADPALKLNFITKWSVERVQILTFIGQAGGVGSGIAGTPIVSEKFMPTIALDNSNVPAQRPLTNDEVQRVLSSLFGRIPSQLNQCRISVEGF